MARAPSSPLRESKSRREHKRRKDCEYSQAKCQCMNSATAVATWTANAAWDYEKCGEMEADATANACQIYAS